MKTRRNPARRTIAGTPRVLGKSMSDQPGKAAILTGGGGGFGKLQ